MTVVELIEKLKQLPQTADVVYVYDGGTYGSADHVWSSNDGRIVLAGSGETVYDDVDRPTTAPTAEENPYWRTPSTP